MSTLNICLCAEIRKKIFTWKPRLPGAVHDSLIFQNSFIKFYLMPPLSMTYPANKKNNTHYWIALLKSYLPLAEFCIWAMTPLELSYETLHFIAVVKVLFSIQRYWYFSYFSTKTCGYSLEVPRRGASNEYPQHMFLWRNKKTINLIPTLI